MNCPSCRQTYGMKLGNQPEGRMDVSFVSKNDYPLEGYDCETIVVDFSLPSGIQGIATLQNGFVELFIDLL